MVNLCDMKFIQDQIKTDLKQYDCFVEDNLTTLTKYLKCIQQAQNAKSKITLTEVNDKLCGFRQGKLKSDFAKFVGELMATKSKAEIELEKLKSLNKANLNLSAGMICKMKNRVDQTLYTLKNLKTALQTSACMPKRNELTITPKSNFEIYCDLTVAAEKNSKIKEILNRNFLELDNVFSNIAFGAIPSPANKDSTNSNYFATLKWDPTWNNETAINLVDLKLGTVLNNMSVKYPEIELCLKKYGKMLPCDDPQSTLVKFSISNIFGQDATGCGLSEKVVSVGGSIIIQKGSNIKVVKNVKNTSTPQTSLNWVAGRQINECIETGGRVCRKAEPLNPCTDNSTALGSLSKSVRELNNYIYSGEYSDIPKRLGYMTQTVKAFTNSIDETANDNDIPIIINMQYLSDTYARASVLLSIPTFANDEILLNARNNVANAMNTLNTELAQNPYAYYNSTSSKNKDLVNDINTVLNDAMCSVENINHFTVVKYNTYSSMGETEKPDLFTFNTDANVMTFNVDQDIKKKVVKNTYSSEFKTLGNYVDKYTKLRDKLVILNKIMDSNQKFASWFNNTDPVLSIVRPFSIVRDLTRLDPSSQMHPPVASDLWTNPTLRQLIIMDGSDNIVVTFDDPAATTELIRGFYAACIDNRDINIRLNDESADKFAKLYKGNAYPTCTTKNCPFTQDTLSHKCPRQPQNTPTLDVHTNFNGFGKINFTDILFLQQEKKSFAYDGNRFDIQYYNNLITGYTTQIFKIRDKESIVPTMKFNYFAADGEDMASLMVRTNTDMALKKSSKSIMGISKGYTGSGKTDLLVGRNGRGLFDTLIANKNLIGKKIIFTAREYRGIAMPFVDSFVDAANNIPAPIYNFVIDEHYKVHIDQANNNVIPNNVIKPKDFAKNYYTGGNIHGQIEGIRLASKTIHATPTNKMSSRSIEIQLAETTDIKTGANTFDVFVDVPGEENAYTTSGIRDDTDGILITSNFMIGLMMQQQSLYSDNIDYSYFNSIYGMSKYSESNFLEFFRRLIADTVYSPNVEPYLITQPVNITMELFNKHFYTNMDAFVSENMSQFESKFQKLSAWIDRLPDPVKDCFYGLHTNQEFLDYKIENPFWTQYSTFTESFLLNGTFHKETPISQIIQGMFAIDEMELNLNNKSGGKRSKFVDLFKPNFLTRMQSPFLGIVMSNDYRITEGTMSSHMNITEYSIARNIVMQEGAISKLISYFSPPGKSLIFPTKQSYGLSTTNYLLFSKFGTTYLHNYLLISQFGIAIGIYFALFKNPKFSALYEEKIKLLYMLITNWADAWDYQGPDVICLKSFFESVFINDINHGTNALNINFKPENKKFQDITLNTIIINSMKYFRDIAFPKINLFGFDSPLAYRPYNYIGFSSEVTFKLFNMPVGVFSSSNEDNNEAREYYANEWKYNMSRVFMPSLDYLSSASATYAASKSIFLNNATTFIYYVFNPKKSSSEIGQSATLQIILPQT